MGDHATTVEQRPDGWYADCGCGWSANNPLPEEEFAREGAAYHEDEVARAEREAAEAAG